MSYGDVVPGLRRFDGQGQLSIVAKQCISTLASPVMSPTYRWVPGQLGGQARVAEGSTPPGNGGCLPPLGLLLTHALRA